MDKYRPKYHFTAPSGWLNDPNGLVHFDGEYHLFYQHLWPRHWGHAVSADMIFWKHLPIALFPDNKGDIWSGCVVVDRNDTCGHFGGKPGLVAVFTHWKDDAQRQSTAFSADRGRTWIPFSGNPVLPNPGCAHFRDPKVFWHSPTGLWIMALTIGDGVAFYKSPDLLHWRESGVFGKGLGPPGTCWECPDMFELPTPEGDPRWVLVFSYVDQAIFNPYPSPGRSGVAYFIGTFDGDQFVVDPANPGHRVSSFGPDDYAPITWSAMPGPPHRAVAIGWMNHWSYAAKVPTSPWQGAMTLPRELALRRVDGALRLVQSPIPEMDTLREAPISMTPRTMRAGKTALNIASGASFELQAEIASTGRVGFVLRAGPSGGTLVGHDADSGRYFIDRTSSGDVSFDKTFPGIWWTDARKTQSNPRFHVFVDQSSVELFTPHGDYLACQIFPAPDAQGMEFFGDRDAHITTFTATPLPGIGPTF